MKTVYHNGIAYTIRDGRSLDPDVYGPEQTLAECEATVAEREHIEEEAEDRRQQAKQRRQQAADTIRDNENLSMIQVREILAMILDVDS